MKQSWRLYAGVVVLSASVTVATMYDSLAIRTPAILVAAATLVAIVLGARDQRRKGIRPEPPRFYPWTAVLVVLLAVLNAAMTDSAIVRILCLAVVILLGVGWYFDSRGRRRRSESAT